VQEDGWSSGAAQGCDNFASHVAGFAEPGNHHFSGIREYQLHRAAQIAVQAPGSSRYGVGFNLHGLARGIEPD
jgi:hypothetical protein